jgi:hypothetical protein
MENLSNIENELNKLPLAELHPSLMILNMDGRAIFPIYGPGAALATKYIVYLFARGEGVPALFDGGDLGRAGFRELGNGWFQGAVEFSYKTVEARRVPQLVISQAKWLAILRRNYDSKPSSFVSKTKWAVDRFFGRLEAKISAFRAV